MSVFALNIFELVKNNSYIWTDPYEMRALDHVDLKVRSNHETKQHKYIKKKVAEMFNRVIKCHWVTCCNFQ